MTDLGLAILSVSLGLALVANVIGLFLLHTLRLQLYALADALARVADATARATGEPVVEVPRPPSLLPDALGVPGPPPESFIPTVRPWRVS